MFIGGRNVPRAARLPTVVRRSSVLSQEGVPAYIASMAAYDVLRLSDLAPSNGNDTIADVFTGDYAEWLTSDPGTIDLRGIINAWCGGFKAIGTSQVLVHGGGHADSANNAIPSFDFSGTSAPVGYTLPVIPSTVANVRTGFSTYSDGKPVAVHTYDGCVRVGNYGYRFGGSRYVSSGDFCNDSWKVNLTSGAWTALSDSSNVGATTPSCVYDPTSNKILLIPALAPSEEWQFFDLSAETWAGTTVPGEYAPYACCSALDTSRNKVLSIGVESGSRRATVATVTWASNTMTVATQTLTGLASGMHEGVSLVYDATLDCYWCWGGSSSTSGGYVNMYRIEADDFSVTSSAFSQTLAVFDGADYSGSYGRFAFMPEWRAIAFVTHANSNTGTHIIKLPSS